MVKLNYIYNSKFCQAFFPAAGHNQPPNKYIKKTVNCQIHFQKKET
jgi:hypothetical protein